MRTIVIGLGVQGNKRKFFSRADFQFSVDPFNEKATYKNLDQVDINSFDSALICVPDEFKFEYVKELVKNGKHVLIEKPFNLSILQSKEIDHLSKLMNTTVYVAYNHRFEPHIITIKKFLEEKRIGENYKLNLFYGNGTAELVKNSVWRDNDLGVISDLASHLFDLVNFWYGLENYEIEVISAHKYENKAYDNAMLKLVGYPEVVLEVSLLSWKNSFRAEFIGSNGSIHLDGLCKWGPSQLILRNRKSPSGVPDEELTTLLCQDPTWEDEYSHFKKLIKSSNLGNLEHSLKISQSFDLVRTKL